MDYMKSGTNELLPATDLATMQTYAENEFKAFWGAFVAQDAVVAGLTPSIPGTGLSCDIAEGHGYKANGSKAAVPADGTYVTFSAAHASLPRVDAVTITPTKLDTNQQTRNFKINGVVTPQSTYKKTIDSFTANAIAGTPTGGADLTNLNGAPAIPPGDILIGYVLVPATATNLNSGHLLDARVMLPTLFAATPADESVTLAKLDPEAYDSAATPETLAYRDADGRMQAADPAASEDVATKGWVQTQTAAAAAGLTDKGAVRCAQSANRVLSGLSAVDGVSIIAGDIVLLLGQSAGEENGPWVAAAGAWTRPANFATSDLAMPGSFWFVNEGSTYADTGWWLTTNGPITLGTTVLSLTQLTGPGAIQATAPIVRTGSTLSHADSGATPGTYTNATVTVDAKGHVTAAANGSLGVAAAVVVDQKSSGTAAQTLTGGWDTRELQTEQDPSGIVSISSDEFTLGAGTYLIDWSAPYWADGVGSGGGKSRLYNATDATVVQYGSSPFIENAASGVFASLGNAVVTIAGSKAFRIEQRGSNTNHGGKPESLATIPEIYTQVKILKVA